MEQIKNDWLFQQVSETLKRNESVKIRLVGQSMYPFLNPNTDILTIIPLVPQKLCVGDIVLAKTRSGYILHRFIGKTKYEWCRLQGDANVWKEESVYIADIIGVLSGVERSQQGASIDCFSVKWRLYGWCWMKLRGCRSLLLNILYWKRNLNKKWRNMKG